MDHEEVGRHWDENAGVWTELVRAGYDHYRDGLNTPAFLEMLPEVDGLSGLDVGCGERHNTRMVARRGGRVVGVDISANFVRHAREAEEKHPLGIRYEVVSAVRLPFEQATFDFATAFMSLMDIPETERVLAEAGIQASGNPLPREPEARTARSGRHSRRRRGRGTRKALSLETRRPRPRYGCGPRSGRS